MTSYIQGKTSHLGSFHFETSNPDQFHSYLKVIMNALLDDLTDQELKELRSDIDNRLKIKRNWMAPPYIFDEE